MKFRHSSAVEQLTVNQLVPGSIPGVGAKFKKAALWLPFLFLYKKPSIFISLFQVTLATAVAISELPSCTTYLSPHK